MTNQARAGQAPSDDHPAVDLRMDVPHSARVYDYLIGGKTNFEADRIAFTGDTDPVGVGGVSREYNARGIPLQVRDKKETEIFFEGYELLDPGVTLVHHWRPDPDAAPVRDQDIAMYAGVAVKR